MRALLALLAFLAASCAGELPAFSSDRDADTWLRATSPFYARMASEIDARGGYTIRSWDQPRGIVWYEDGARFIQLNPTLKGAERVSILIFELTNAFQEAQHGVIDQRARTGEIKEALVFALRHEMVEYDGLRYHRDVLAELDQAIGGIPREMLTWISPPLTTLESYHLLLAHEYLEAQGKSGHTDFYLKYFPLRQAEKPE